MEFRERRRPLEVACGRPVRKSAVVPEAVKERFVEVAFVKKTFVDVTPPNCTVEVVQSVWGVENVQTADEDAICTCPGVSTNLPANQIVRLVVRSPPPRSPEPAVIEVELAKKCVEEAMRSLAKVPAQTGWN
jgi:hypothetical protein